MEAVVVALSCPPLRFKGVEELPVKVRVPALTLRVPNKPELLRSKFPLPVLVKSLPKAPVKLPVKVS